MTAKKKKKKKDNIQAKKSTRDTNRTMGIAAIFISVLSMVAVIYQSYLAREDNELTRIQQSATVLPYLSQWYNTLDGKYKFVVANKGVGPAFVKEVNLIATDPQTKDSIIFDSSHKLLSFMIQNSKTIDTTSWVKFSLEPNMLISKDEIIEVYSFAYHDQNHKKLIQKEFRKLFGGYSIVYEDVYGSSWMLDSKNGYPVKLSED